MILAATQWSPEKQVVLKKVLSKYTLLKGVFFSVNFENESLQRYLELTPT